MSVVVMPLPAARLEPFERGLVTGSAEDVALRSVPVEGLFFQKEARLPLTPRGYRLTRRRSRIAWGLLAASLVLSVLLALGVQVGLGTGGMLVGVVTLVTALIVVRAWRRRALYVMRRRPEMLVVDAPSDVAARSLRAQVDRAELPSGLRERLESARKLGDLNQRRHVLAR